MTKTEYRGVDVSCSPDNVGKEAARIARSGLKEGWRVVSMTYSERVLNLLFVREVWVADE